MHTPTQSKCPNSIPSMYDASATTPRDNGKKMLRIGARHRQKLRHRCLHPDRAQERRKLGRLLSRHQHIERALQSSRHGWHTVKVWLRPRPFPMAHRFFAAPAQHGQRRLCQSSSLAQSLQPLGERLAHRASSRTTARYSRVMSVYRSPSTNAEEKPKISTFWRMRASLHGNRRTAISSARWSITALPPRQRSLRPTGPTACTRESRGRWLPCYDPLVCD
jgi:hypothetical protein